MGSRLDSQRSPFIRTNVTWAAYLMLGYFAYLQAILGPLMPFLRQDLHLSYSGGALHFSAFAAGMVAAGAWGNRVTTQVGRTAAFWGGGGGMAIGACGLVAGRDPIVTIAGAGVMGLCGSLLLIAVQAMLSDQYGPLRTRALTEANVVASLCTSIAAFNVGVCQGSGLGWRMAVLIACVLLLVLAARFRRTPLPTREPHAPRHAHTDGRLPAIFWLVWLALAVGVSAEWCMAFWGTEYLHTVIGLNSSTAAYMMSLYLLVTVGGRVVGSKLAAHVPSASLLGATAVVALGGFLLFWLSPRGPLTPVGLCITGVGISNLFPLSLATGLNIVPALPDLASARASLGAGLAILVAPICLGALADRLGLRLAYGAVPVLLASVGLIVLPIMIKTTGRVVPATRQTAAGHAAPC